MLTVRRMYVLTGMVVDMSTASVLGGEKPVWRQSKGPGRKYTAVEAVAEPATKDYWNSMIGMISRCEPKSNRHRKAEEGR